MIRKLIGSIVILVVILGVILCMILGKDTVSDIAAKVLDAAEEELTAQVQEKLGEFPVEVIEVRPAVGKLNDDGGKYQFYCAALVQATSEDAAEDCAKALNKVFGDADFVIQADRKVDDDRLEHKSITYKHQDFSEGNYYTVYVYVDDIEDMVDLDKLEDKIKG